MFTETIICLLKNGSEQDFQQLVGSYAMGRLFQKTTERLGK